MKIAIDATVLWGERRYSGVEKMVDRVVYRILQSDGDHEFRVFVPGDWAGFEEDLEGRFQPGISPAIFPLPFRGGQRLLRIGWQQISLPRTLASWGADVIFSPAYIMPLRARCPAVVYVHDLHGLRLDRTRPENYLHHRLFLPPTLRRARTVITNSQAVLDEVRPLLPRTTRCLSIPLGVDAMFSPGPRESPSPQDENDDPFILFVGNLERRKGLDLVLGAMPVIVERRPDLRLMLVGKDRGGLAATREIIQRLDLADHVEIAGFVSPERLVGLYRRARVLVLPSLSEGFGLTPLEAMACATPVVAVDSPAVRENLGDAAILVPPLPSDLAAAILRVLEDANLRGRLVSAGPEHARQFTWERTAEGILDEIVAAGGMGGVGD